MNGRHRCKEVFSRGESRAGIMAKRCSLLCQVATLMLPQWLGIVPGIPSELAGPFDRARPRLSVGHVATAIQMNGRLDRKVLYIRFP